MSEEPVASVQSENDFYKQPTLVVAPSPAPAPSQIPEKIGPYVIQSLLEKGGMSLLYLGIDPETKDPLTVKVLTAELSARKDLVERFLKEASIIAMTDHPNIVKLKGQGEWEGGLYIAMEFIQGMSLRQFLLQQTMSLRKALELILQVAYAICHLHVHGVIHRDLKPENILLTATGGIKVVDFGIAQLFSEIDYQKSAAESPYMGTPFYMSPEQRKEPLKASFPADIYSLGLITYELVLGRPSFGVVHLSLMPLGLQKILDKALQPDPKDRYQDIVDFITDVSKYLESGEADQEKKGKDRTSEAIENVEKLAKSLVPVTPIEVLPGITLHISTETINAPFHLLVETLQLEGGTRAVIFAQPILPAPDGKRTIDPSALLYSSLFKGLASAVAKIGSVKTTTDLAEKLNTILISDPWKTKFCFGCLFFYPQSKEVDYLTCGYGPLWHMVSDSTGFERVEAYNMALGETDGMEFLSNRWQWQDGEKLMVSNLWAHDRLTGTQNEASTSWFSQQEMEEILEKNKGLPTAKLSNTVSLNIKTVGQKHEEVSEAILIAMIEFNKSASNTKTSGVKTMGQG